MLDREHVAQIIDPQAFVIVNSKRAGTIDRQRQALTKADTILAAQQDAREAGTAEWIAYADKLEEILRKVADLSDDQLKRMQADEGLRIVRPAANAGS